MLFDDPSPHSTTARCWYTKIDSFLLARGFSRLESDHSVYISDDGSIVAVYVDDLLIVGNDAIKAEISKAFDIKDLGEAKFLLGIELDYSARLRRKATSYIGRVLWSDTHHSVVFSNEKAIAAIFQGKYGLQQQVADGLLDFLRRWKATKGAHLTLRGRMRDYGHK